MLLFSNFWYLYMLYTMYINFLAKNFGYSIEYPWIYSRPTPESIAEHMLIELPSNKAVTEKMIAKLFLWKTNQEHIQSDVIILFWSMFIPLDWSAWFLDNLVARMLFVALTLE